MIEQYTGGTVPIAKWQVKLAQRVAGFEPGRYIMVVDMPAMGTVEPTWSIVAMGKVENGR